VLCVRYELKQQPKPKNNTTKERLFVCNNCNATYVDKSRLSTEKCPICLNRKMSSFPILPNEAFTFNYNDKRGVDLEFRPRKKKEKKDQE
jgi:hypothetical protein